VTEEGAGESVGGAEEESALDADRASEGPAQSARAEARGETVGEAKWAAMKELERRHPGIAVEHVEFEVLEEGSPDGDEGAKVAALADLSAWQESEARFDWPDEPAERVREILRRVTMHLDLRTSVDIEEDDEELRASVSGLDLGLFIGKHGQTIDAVQFICAQAAFRGDDQRKRVTVDAGGYRERREAALHRQAERGVADAVRYGRPIELDSMSAQERRTVHVYLRDRHEVETHSEGDDPFRRIVITPARQRLGD
jgi:spoIIIJ-associated protein